jgi:hypothetical protein
MKFLDKYNKFFEAKRIPLGEKSDDEAFWGWYSRDSSAKGFFFVSYILYKLAGWDKSGEENDSLSDTDRMTDLMSLSDENKNRYTTNLSKLRKSLETLKSGKGADIKDMIWKIKKSSKTGELATISFNDDGKNRLMSCNFIIDIITETPPRELYEFLIIKDKFQTVEDFDNQTKKLNEWLYDNAKYVVNTDGIYLVNSPGPDGWAKTLAPMINNYTVESPNSKGRIIGNKNGFDSLSEAIRQIWLWLIAKNINPVDKNPETKLDILMDYIEDSSNIEGKELNIEAINRIYTLHPTKNYFTKITDVCKSLESLYKVLGLKIEYEVQKDTDYAARIDTSSDMVKWITISTNLHSVPNSFLDIVTKAVYGNNTCTYTDAKWKKQTYKPEMVEKEVDGKKVFVPLEGGLYRPDQQIDIEGILVNLPSVVRNKSAFKSSNVDQKLKFEFNIAPLTRESAIKGILDVIAKYFSITNKLIVNGKEVDDIFELINCITGFTSILLNNMNNLDANLINNDQLYRLLYTSIVKEGVDESPIAKFNADGTIRKDGLKFAQEIIKSIEVNGVNPLNTKFKAYEQKAVTATAKAAKRGHKTSSDDIDDLLGFNPQNKK